MNTIFKFFLCLFTEFSFVNKGIKNSESKEFHIIEKISILIIESLSPLTNMESE